MQYSVTEFETIYLRCFPPAMRLAISLLHDEDDAATPSRRFFSNFGKRIRRCKIRWRSSFVRCAMYASTASRPPIHANVSPDVFRSMKLSIPIQMPRFVTAKYSQPCRLFSPPGSDRSSTGYTPKECRTRRRRIVSTYLSH